MITKLNQLNEKHFALIPIAFYLIGFFIHNLYLSSFGIYDIEILKVKYIYTGTLTVFFFSITASLITIKTNLSIAKENFKIGPLSAWFSRIVIFSFMVYFILADPDTKLQNDFLTSQIQIPQAILDFIQFLFTLLFILILTDMLGNPSKKDIMVSNYFQRFQSFLSIPLAIVFAFLLFHNDLFRAIALIFLLEGIFIMSSIFGKNDAEHGIYGETLYNTSNNRTHIIHKTFFSATMLVIPIFLIFKLFATNIYPIIPANYGGSKPVLALIQIENKTVKAQIINEGPTWMLILPSGSLNVIRIKTDDVKRFELISRSVQPTY